MQDRTHNKSWKAINQPQVVQQQMEPRKRIGATGKAASIAIRPVALHRKVRIIGNTFAVRVELVVNGGISSTELLTACSKVIGQKFDKRLRRVPFLSARQKSRLIGNRGVVCSPEATWATRNLLES